MLKAFINPKTIALVGATDRKNSVGLALIKNLAKSRAKLFFVNPHKKTLFKKRVFASLGEIKEGIDLVLIAVPAGIVPQIARDCALAKVRAVVIISANFAEAGKDGLMLENKVKQILEEARIPFLGPNCFGLINPFSHLNTTFSSLAPQKGRVAFLSQSGAIINVLIEKSLKEQKGFSLMVSLGNMAGLNFADWLSFLEQSKETKAVALYLESVKDGAGFIKAAQALSRKKPIFVLKGGKTEKGGAASLGHTGALASDYKIYSAAFKKAGIFEVDDLEDLFFLSQNFAPGKIKKLAVLTNAGGLGVIAADLLNNHGLKNFSLKDLIGTAGEDDFEKALNKADCALVIVSNQMMTRPLAIAKTILKVQKQFPRKLIISCFVSEEKAALNFLAKNKQIVFNNLRQACLFLKFLNDKI